MPARVTDYQNYDTYERDQFGKYFAFQRIDASQVLQLFVAASIIYAITRILIAARGDPSIGLLLVEQTGYQKTLTSTAIEVLPTLAAYLLLLPLLNRITRRTLGVHRELVWPTNIIWLPIAGLFASILNGYSFLLLAALVILLSLAQVYFVKQDIKKDTNNVSDTNQYLTFRRWASRRMAGYLAFIILLTTLNNSTDALGPREKIETTHRVYFGVYLGTNGGNDLIYTDSAQVIYLKSSTVGARHLCNEQRTNPLPQWFSRGVHSRTSDTNCPGKH